MEAQENQSAQGESLALLLVKVSIIALLSTFCSGCLILPIPHQRLHALGVESLIVDASNGRPIASAFVTNDYTERIMRTDAEGRFAVPPEWGWHGAMFIGAISYSLLPSLDVPPPERTIHVSAPGYVSRDFSIGPPDPVGTPARVEGNYLKPVELKLTPSENVREATEESG